MKILSQTGSLMTVERSSSETSCKNYRRRHAPDMGASCGALSPPTFVATYRCDLTKDHIEDHHACGEHWEVDWL